MIIGDNEEDFEREFSSFNTLYTNIGQPRSYMRDKLFLIGNGEFQNRYKASVQKSVKQKTIEATSYMCRLLLSDSIVDDYIYMIDEPFCSIRNGLLNGNDDSLYTLIDYWRNTIEYYDPGKLFYLDFGWACTDYQSGCPNWQRGWYCSDIEMICKNANFDIISNQHYNISSGHTLNTSRFVRGIKSVSNKPTWIFLDASLRFYQSIIAEKGVIDIDYYSRIIKAQAYTAIVNGATGVLFFRGDNDIIQDQYNDYWIEVWDSTKALAEELRENQFIFEGEKIEYDYENEIFMALYKIENEYYRISVNTNHFSTKSVKLSKQGILVLSPLEVVVKKMPKDDLLIRYPPNGNYFVCMSEGNKFEDGAALWEEDFGRSHQSLYIGDFNGDNLDDLLLRDVAPGRYWVSISSGTNFYMFPSIYAWKYYLGDASQEFNVGDFNGDGKDDLLLRDTLNGNFTVCLSEGDCFASEEVVWEENFGHYSQDLHIGDFNGDGCDDLLLRHKSYIDANNRYYVSLSTGYSFEMPASNPWEENFGHISQDLFIGDFNGDGLDDLLLRHKRPIQANNKYYVSLSTGSSFQMPIAAPWLVNFGVESLELKVGDFNGDGKDDILLRKKDIDFSKNMYWVALSTGSCFEPDSIIWKKKFGVACQELEIGNFGNNASLTRSLSISKGVNDLESNNSEKQCDINVFPNPFINQLYINSYSLKGSFLQVSIYGVDGRFIIANNYNVSELNELLDVSDLIMGINKGVYFLKVTNKSDNKNNTFLVIKKR